MKPRYIAISVVAVVAVATGGLLLQRLTDPGVTLARSPSSSHEAEPAERQGLIPRAPASPDIKAPLTPPVPASDSDTEARDGDEPAQDLQSGYVQQRIQELQDLAMENDSASLKAIISELANPDPEIRKAALEATIQFSSRDAIPGLQQAAARTTDAKEKAAIEEAIEFLKLPSLTEVMQEQGRKQATPTQPLRAVTAPPGQNTNP